MTQKKHSVGLCAMLLAAALLWRILGAPVTAEDFQNLQVPFWQARVLLPQRVERMMRLWLTGGGDTEEQSALYSGEDFDREPVMVYLTEEEKWTEMAMSDYVQGVVAAEMPARYHLEALKAQAVAARTRVLWQRQNGGCELHPGADICTDAEHCQGYSDWNECREKWQESSEVYQTRLVQAQSETKGEWISYQGEPIAVLYHANSGGRTENVQTVFTESIPYLVSVKGYEDETAAGFQQETRLTFDEIAERIECQAEEVQRSFTIVNYTDSGRVGYVQVGEKKISGSELRKLLGLRSTMFTISMDETGITFHQRGYGHGVGMSQTGANQMAAMGYTYTQILQHYYTGVEIECP